MDVGDWIAASFAILWAIAAIGLAAAAAMRKKATRSPTRRSEADTRTAAASEPANQLTQTQAPTNGHAVWEIVPEGQPGNWFLRNGSTEDAFDVTVAAGDLRMTLIPGRHQDVVHPHGGFLLTGGHDADMQDPMITVTWHRSPDRSDPARRWSRPLPAE